MAHRAGSLGRGPRLCHNDLMISHICGFGSSNSRSPVRGRAGRVAVVTGVVSGLVALVGAQVAAGAAVFPEASDLRLAGASSVSLHGVSCPAGGNCVGVGYFLGNNPDQNGQFLASDTTGGWKTSVPPLPAGGLAGNTENSLGSVSCPVAWTCTAVGSYQSKNGTLPLVETGTGSAWQPAATVALPAGASGSGTFSAVSCTKAGTCLAVGTYGYLFNYHDMAVLSTGGQWGRAQAVEVELPPGGSATVPGLDAVSCAGTWCLAVGEYDKSFYVKPGMAVAESGGKFQRAVQVQPPASDPTFVETTLSGVSCNGPATCAIAGTYRDPKTGNASAMVASEVDGVWKPSVAIEMPLGAGEGSSLSGVSCVSVGNCEAVGSYHDASGTQRPIAVEETDGHWAQAVEIGVPADAGPSTLNAISCSSLSSCGAVGGAAHDVALVLLSNGTHAVAPPPPRPRRPSPARAQRCLQSVKATIPLASPTRAPAILCGSGGRPTAARNGTPSRSPPALTQRTQRLRSGKQAVPR